MCVMRGLSPSSASRRARTDLARVGGCLGRESVGVGLRGGGAHLDSWTRGVVRRKERAKGSESSWREPSQLELGLALARHVIDSLSPCPEPTLAAQGAASQGEPHESSRARLPGRSVRGHSEPVEEQSRWLMRIQVGFQGGQCYGFRMRQGP